MADPSRSKLYEEKFSDSEIPRPPHWGGYLVRPVTIEFWQGRPNRLTRPASIYFAGKWQMDD